MIPGLIPPILLAVASLGATAASAADCVFVSSYHRGYEWNDGIERGLDRTLAGHCRVEKLYMDTKRHQEPAFARSRALAISNRIATIQPDVVIACDDNASKYLIQPFFRDAQVPIVFCGINHSTEPYGYPYRNATGMVEIAPVKPLLRLSRQIRNPLGEGIYIGPDVLSQHKEFALNRGIYQDEGIHLTPRFVRNSDEWKSAFLDSQTADIVIVGSNGGLSDWDRDHIREFVQDHARTLLVTNMEWMITYAMIAVTKIAEEQGEWAGKSAVAILNGTPVERIPIVPNQRWNIYVNPRLLHRAGIDVPAHILRKAIQLQQWP